MNKVVAIGIGAAIAGVVTLAIIAGGKSPPAQTIVVVSEAGGASQAQRGMPLDDLQERTGSEANARVAHVFPNGPATEDAGASIGTAPAPAAENAKPDGESQWVAELELASPVAAAKVREAYPSDDAHLRMSQGRIIGTPRWVYVADADANASFDRIDVLAPLVTIEGGDRSITEEEVAAYLGAARTLATKVGAAAPKTSMSSERAVKKGKAALALRDAISDLDRSSAIAVTPTGEKLFPGKLVWDVLYSAGFFWGDGDYFHWIPSPTTDTGQGISVASANEGYFFPEALEAKDGSADVGSLDFSFDVGRSFSPVQVFEVMLRAARYSARRLDAKLSDELGGAFDEKAAREKVVKIDKQMRDAGVVPGSLLALTIF